MIDFKKIGTGNTVDTVLPPREIFNALPHKDAVKFQYPRDVQSQVWNDWFERRDENSLVIKMNTGGGKTIVGLLILKSSLNDGKFPAVYTCPDNYLVEQVKDAAADLGLEVTTDAKSQRFLSGKSILIANIYKLVNGMSVFGVGDTGIKIKISSLIIDDAHACLDTIESQFTMDIPAGSEAFQKLYNIFSDSLHSECESKALEIEHDSTSSYMQVPYWVWQEKLPEITQILYEYNQTDDKFVYVWNLIKEQLKLCNCVVSATGIEISPHSIPIHIIPSILEAERKVFMTATLADNSILSSHFGVDEKDITSPITPESAGDIGDRMILLPQAINHNTSDVEIKEYCKIISEHINVVVIVPSFSRATFWQDVADKTLDKDTLYEGIERLKHDHVGLTILVNRYDGIDLPGAACRLLVIDGLPDVRRKIDKVKQNLLLGSEQELNQLTQKIEQGMGRGVRSNDDFCVIFLTGLDLTRHLYSHEASKRFSMGTNAQLHLSDQLSDQVLGKSIFDLTEIIEYCLERNNDWVTASKGVLATLKYQEEDSSNKITISLRNAYDLASKGHFIDASNIIKNLVNTTDNKKEKGYLKQIFAEYINLYDKPEAQKTQMSAIKDNSRVLRPISGVEYHKIAGQEFDQARSCSEFLGQYNDPNKLVVEVNAVISNLQFEIISHKIFEEEMKNIIRFLGLQSQRPEEEYKKGPDVLWADGEKHYFVIECKNEALSTTTTITKTYCNQLNGSCNWFEGKYGHQNYTPIMIHPSSTFTYAASPNPKIRIITAENLLKLCNSVKSFIASVALTNELNNPEKIRSKLIAQSLRSSDLVDMYTSPYKINH